MGFVVFVRLLIISICSIDSACGKHKEFFYFNVAQSVNDKYINASPPTEACDANTRESPCKVTPVVKVDLKADLTRPILQFRLTEVSKNKTFLQQTLNVCSMEKQPGLNIFVRFITDQLKESTNFKFECPIKKDYYEVKSFTISPRFDLLMNFFQPHKTYNVYAFVRNNFGGKLMEMIYAYSFDLEIVEVG